MSQSSNQSHKSIVEQIADAVRSRQISKLGNFLDIDIQKKTNSKSYLHKDSES